MAVVKKTERPAPSHADIEFLVDMPKQKIAKGDKKEGVGLDTANVLVSQKRAKILESYAR